MGPAFRRQGERAASSGLARCVRRGMRRVKPFERAHESRCTDSRTRDETSNRNRYVIEYRRHRPRGFACRNDEQRMSSEGIERTPSDGRPNKRRRIDVSNTATEDVV